MMYVYYNPNPCGHQTGDCVVRAICAATGQTWDQSYDGVVLEGKRLAKMPTTNEVWESYLLRLGFRRYDLPDMCPDCYTVADFARDHPAGVYILGTGSHAVTVKNGSIMDAWNCSQKIPRYYFVKKQEE